MKKLCSTVVAGSLLAIQVSGASVKNVMERAQKGELLNVVFFGGSLTWGANASDPNVSSWRGLTMKFLRGKYPRTSWQFKDSAIGGTGSTLGVFRMERDVFRHNPDLVLLDFTLNDNLLGGEKGLHDERNQSYEAIIRECVKRKVAVLPVFTVSKKHAEMQDISTLKRRLEHIELFKKYNLDYADILGLMNQEYQKGKIDTSVLWPAGLFDVTHPHDAGYAAYTELFIREWNRIESSPEKQPVLPQEFVSGKTFSNLLRVNLPELKLNGWKVCYPCPVSDCFDWLASRYLDKVVTQANAEQISGTKWQYNGGKLEPFTFKVKAERLAALIETVPESVPFSVSVDGREPVEIKCREVSRSQLHFVTLASGLEPGKWHTITVIPKNPADNTPGVMRWGALLLNSSSETEFSL